MIEKAELKDYKELLTFETRVFKTPFLFLMPKLYKDKNICTQSSRIIRENGKIIGAYSACYNGFKTSEKSLKAVGIASVAVDKKYRNKGHMGEMLRYADEEAQKIGADIAYLGGLRHRYERFGYIPCGEKFVYDVTEHYASHAKKKEKFSFTTLKKNSVYLDDIIKLFEKQKYHWLRSKDDFYLISKTWFNRCFVIKDECKHFAGYMITDASLGEINEIQLNDVSKLSDVLVSFLEEQKKNKSSVCVMPWQNEILRELSLFGENYRVTTSASFKFYNFRKPIEIMMNEKLKNAALCEGSTVIKLGEETLKIEVRNRKCSVSETEEEPQTVLSYSEAMIAVTTHYSSDNPLLSAWSPMCPIAIPRADKV